MELKFRDTTALPRPARQARSGPYIPGGRPAAPTPTAQLHSSDHEIPARQGGYFHVGTALPGVAR
ncbi:hypothetical protein [Streptomyces sp. 4F14]|uniref:hypothetical protein n=1 Tax=Streptomyces sp. 4F14 TaxID=3394380 RepID=UPI003A866D61